MPDKQIQKVNNSLSFSDQLIQSRFNNLSEEAKNALAESAARKRLDLEEKRAEGFIKDESAQRNIDEHIRVRQKMQIDSYSKGADSVTSNIETASGHMTIESRSGKCYVATATYQDSLHPNVILLRDFRDRFLRKSILGRLFISFYYALGPYFAYLPEHSLIIRRLSKCFIDKIVLGIRKNYY